MKKIIMAAGIAASMLFATSAFAETTNSITPKYDPKSGNVTLTGEGVKSRATTTYLVISLGKTAPKGMYTGDIKDTMIKQINQVDGTSTVEEILVGAGLDDGFYEVRMGGDGNVAYGVFEVKTVVTPPDLSTQEGAKEYYKTCTRIMGDVDDEAGISSTDIGYATNHFVNLQPLKGEKLQAADVDNDGDITSTDIGYMTNYFVGLTTPYVDGESLQVKDKTTYVLETSN